MTDKHPLCDVIVAWAEGKAVQFKQFKDKKWNDFIGTDTPSFSFTMQWRVKPKTIVRSYHMALVNESGSVQVRAFDTTDSTIENPAEHEIKGFIRWIGETVKVEIEENM